MGASLVKEFLIRGCRMKVTIAGEGPTLLLVHGFPLNHQMWRHQIDFFSKTMQVVAPDLRGFGNSSVDDAEQITMQDYAADLVELIETLAPVAPVTFCGLSMGGYIGWQLLATHGHLVDSLILTNTRSGADDEKTARGRRLLAGQVLKHGIRELAYQMPLKLLSSESEDGLEAELRAVIAACDPRSVAAAQLGMSARPNMSGMLSEIAQPTLVVCGTDDVITPPEEMREMACQISNASYVEIPSAGHMSPLEQPEKFNAAVDSFLRKCRDKCSGS